MSGSLVGGIVERKSTPGAAPTTPSAPSGSRGFPVAKHRSQSAFARSRQSKADASTTRSRPTSVPVVQPTGTLVPHSNGISTLPGASSLSALRADGDTQDWRAQMSEQNADTVERMSDEQRQQAISEIFDTLGDGVGDLLQRARAARARQQLAGEHASATFPRTRADPRQPRQSPLRHLWLSRHKKTTRQAQVLLQVCQSIPL